MVPSAMDIVDGHHPGAPSTFSCPDCGGVLWEIHDGDIIRFRCRTGHAYSADSLLSHQTDAMDEALWVALRALEESAQLARRLEARARRRGQRRAMLRFDEQASDAEARVTAIRVALARKTPLPADASDVADEARSTDEDTKT
jgi:two-component system chemotaxis response regulator CheB